MFLEIPRIPPPSFGGPSNFIKRGENVMCVRANTLRFSTQSPKPKPLSDILYPALLTFIPGSNAAPRNPRDCAVRYHNISFVNAWPVLKHEKRCTWRSLVDLLSNIRFTHFRKYILKKIKGFQFVKIGDSPREIHKVVALSVRFQ